MPPLANNIQNSNNHQQLAAYTIEAGSKIFSCRVDIVSSKVIKCMNAVTVKGGGTVEEEATEDEGKGPDMKDVQDLETAEGGRKVDLWNY